MHVQVKRESIHVCRHVRDDEDVPKMTPDKPSTTPPSPNLAVLMFQDLVLDGTSGLDGVGNPEPQLLGDDCLRTCASTKLEGDNVWVLFLGSDLEDVPKGVAVLDTPPTCSVREFSEDYHGVQGEQDVTRVEGEKKW